LMLPRSMPLPQRKFIDGPAPRHRLPSLAQDEPRGLIDGKREFNDGPLGELAKRM
jgi:hypothetical protein